MPAGRAAAQPAPHRPPVAADGAAEAAHEAVAPANALQVAQARLIVSEPRGQLVEAARVVDPRLRRDRRHAATLRRQVDGSGYPTTRMLWMRLKRKAAYLPG